MELLPTALFFKQVCVCVCVLVWELLLGVVGKLCRVEETQAWSQRGSAPRSGLALHKGQVSLRPPFKVWSITLEWKELVSSLICLQ